MVKGTVKFHKIFDNRRGSRIPSSFLTRTSAQHPVSRLLTDDLDLHHANSDQCEIVKRTEIVEFEYWIPIRKTTLTSRPINVAFRQCSPFSTTTTRDIPVLLMIAVATREGNV